MTAEVSTMDRVMNVIRSCASLLSAKSLRRGGRGRAVLFLLAPVLLLSWRLKSTPSPSSQGAVQQLDVATARSTAAAAGLDCRTLLRISSFRQRWEESLDGVSQCSDYVPDASDMQRCWIHLAAGRESLSPARVVFVGDNRLRYVYERTRYRTKLPPLKRPYEIPLDESGFFESIGMDRAPDDYWELFKLSMHKDNSKEVKNQTFGSYRAGNAQVQMEFWWRPYPSRSFISKVAELADDCTSQAERCPALVILGSGLWTARRFQLTETATAADWASRYRAGLIDVLSALQRLASATNVIWKLDEPVFQQEVNKVKPGVIMSSLTAIHSMVYSTLSQVPGVTIWSAMVPNTIRFFRQVCWARNQVLTLLSNSDCRNKYYVGVPLLDAHVTQLLDYLCRGSSPSPGLCCAKPDI